MGIQSDLNILRNKMKVLAILLTVVAVALAQDTHFCPDNWELHKPEGKDTCSCFYFAGRDVRVNHADATTLCQIRGGWLAQVEDAPEENYWAEGEPNDYHRQQCMSYLRYTYFGNPTFQWNDWDCNTVADYICEKPCETSA